MNQSLYVQYGCGFSASSGWRNFDASPTLRFERLPLISRLYAKNASPFPDNVEYGDIIRGLPVALKSCKGVYCSHVLEHLALTDCRIALLNTYKILQPGGIFRLVLPDLEFYLNQYQNDPSKDAAITFMRETSLGHEQRLRSLRQYLISLFGNSQHLWMWDYKSIKSELEVAGFVGIKRATYGDSADPYFNKVEHECRWNNCLGIECIRPT